MSKRRTLNSQLTCPPPGFIPRKAKAVGRASVAALTPPEACGAEQQRRGVTILGVPDTSSPGLASGPESCASGIGGGGAFPPDAQCCHPAHAGHPTPPIEPWHASRGTGCGYRRQGRGGSSIGGLGGGRCPSRTEPSPSTTPQVLPQDSRFRGQRVTSSRCKTRKCQYSDHTRDM